MARAGFVKLDHLAVVKTAANSNFLLLLIRHPHLAGVALNGLGLSLGLRGLRQRRNWWTVVADGRRRGWYTFVRRGLVGGFGPASKNGVAPAPARRPHALRGAAETAGNAIVGDATSPVVTIP